MDWIRFASGLSMMAWGVAVGTAALPVSPRIFFLALVLAASTTIPLLTVMCARKHVHAYLAGWVDRHEHEVPPDGGTECTRDKEPEQTHLRAA